MQSPYIEDHLWQGWAIFTLLMIPTYLIARRIEERDARKAAAPPAGAVAAGFGTDLSAVVGPAMLSRARQTALVAVSGPILFYAISVLPAAGDLDRDPEVFGFVEGWDPVGDPSGGDWTPEFVGYDEQVAWSLRGPEGAVEAARFYYVDQRQGEELIQYNNRIAPDSLTAASRIIGPIGASRRFVHETVVRDAEVPRVVWHWYRVAGFDTPFESKAKLLEILAFFRRSPAAELVLLAAPCAPDDCTDAAMTLREATGVPVEGTGPSEDAEGAEGPGEATPGRE